MTGSRPFSDRDPEHDRESDTEGAADGGELTRRLVWLPPPPPLASNSKVPAHQRPLVPDPNPGADRRAFIVVLVVAVLVAAALLVAFW